MAKYELTPTKYRNYPEKVTYSVPLAVTAGFPRGARYMTHTVYLGRQNHGQPQENAKPLLFRNFWEQEIPTRRAQGKKVSQAEYQDALNEIGVPQAPIQGLWRMVAGFWVAEINTLAMVEVPTDGNIRQGRVTTVSKRRPPQSSEASYTKVATADEYVQQLEALGFPVNSFDYMHSDTRYLEGKTDRIAKILQLPIIKQVANAIEKRITWPLTARSMRRNPNNQFTTRIRTENPRQPVTQ